MQGAGQESVNESVKDARNHDKDTTTAAPMGHGTAFMADFHDAPVRRLNHMDQAGQGILQ
jgi:hypothetical protein